MRRCSSRFPCSGSPCWRQPRSAMVCIGAGHVSQQGLQIKVVGTFEDPHTEKKALPAVNDMLEHIHSELQEGAASISPGTASRGARKASR